MRIVIKIGTKSLLSKKGTLDEAVVTRLVEQIVHLKKQDVDVVLISSGAVGTGRRMLETHGRKIKIHDPMVEKQFMASIGQSELIHIYNNALKHFDLIASQLLMTRHDLKRRHYVNISRLLEEILKQKSVLPILNENDGVSAHDSMFTDNDTLAGLVAAMLNADKLIILTSVDGVFDPSKSEPTLMKQIEIGKNWPHVDESKSAEGRGGMFNKLDVAKTMAQIGIVTHIANADADNVLVRLYEGEDLGTKVVPIKKPSAMKRWLAVHPEDPKGQVIVNKCLGERLISEDCISILPVGLEAVSVPFDKDDIVEIVDMNGHRLGIGQARYDSDELEGYIGLHQKPIFIRTDAMYIEAQEGNDE